METLYPLIEQGGAIVGLTALLGTLIPEGYGKYIKPWIAMLLGIAAVCYPKWAAEGILTPADIQAGIILGGTVTGLYKVVRG